MTNSQLTDPSYIRVVSIGGTGMFGMNCLLLESKTTKLLIDCGVMFPADDDLGVDLITPDFTIIEQDPPKALLITHAHEDHIGAIPYLLLALIQHGFHAKLPIYATDFTIALIKRRLEEHDLLKYVEFNCARPKTTKQFGDITVEFIDVCHSIPGSLAFAFDTPVGKIVHSGDWRIDNTPMSGAKTNLARFEALGDEGVRLFLSDSTNVEIDNESITSEHDVFNNIQNYIKQAPGRVFVTLFASNIGRLQSIIYAAANTGRKLAVCGRSMLTNIATARELEYLRIPLNLEIIHEEDINATDDNLIIIVSGSQGEKNASLFKIAQGEHPRIKLRKTDTLIYSARQIPGNERRVNAIINGFYRQGASLVNQPDLTFHSSGHGTQRELELLIELIAPQIFVPVHGDHRRLAQHEKLAQRTGEPMITEIIDEGQCLILYPDHHEIHDGYIPFRRYVVGKCINGITSAIMKEKKNLAHQGILVVSGVLNSNDEIVGNLRIHPIGICANDGWMDELEPELYRTISCSAHHGDMEEIVRHKAAKYIKQAIAKFPVIVVDFHRI
ncbi:MAG: ribonuclease J [Proteobacteria bacterium]|nr:ribonuclease J [Pseudomonadota bacterium]